MSKTFTAVLNIELEVTEDELAQRLRRAPTIIDARNFFLEKISSMPISIVETVNQDPKILLNPIPDHEA